MKIRRSIVTRAPNKPRPAVHDQGDVFSSLGDVPSGLFELPGDDVHVWQVAVEDCREEADGLGGALDESERARAARFHSVGDRCRSVVTRGALRHLLGRYLHCAPSEPRFCFNPFGKPALATPRAEEMDIRFNVSHSRERVILAFSRQRELGVDVEWLRPELRIEEIGRDFFSKGELRELHALPSGVQRAGFFHCWCRKEALVKAMGRGLSMALDGFQVSVRPDASAVTLRIENDDDESRRWSIVALNAGVDYVAALAVEGEGFVPASEFAQGFS